jgi:hypothetical protein
MVVEGVEDNTDHVVIVDVFAFGVVSMWFDRLS